MHRIMAARGSQLFPAPAFPCRSWTNNLDVTDFGELAALPHVSTCSPPFSALRMPPPRPALASHAQTLLSPRPRPADLAIVNYSGSKANFSCPQCRHVWHMKGAKCGSCAERLGGGIAGLLAADQTGAASLPPQQCPLASPCRAGSICSTRRHPALNGMS